MSHPFYHTHPSRGVQCADSFDSPRIQKREGGTRVLHGERFGSPIPCSNLSLSSETLARYPRFSSLPTLPALVIAASASCFERARRQAAGAKLEATRVAAVLANASSSATLHCRDHQLQRTVDGVTSAHRAAWSEILRAGRAMAVFEEDAELIGDAADTHAAVERCERAGCDLAYLGLTGDIFGAFAYWATPRAAAHLLEQATRPRCNRRKPDYALRAACLGQGLLDCLGHDVRARPTCDAAMLTATSLREQQCARMITRGYRPPKCRPFEC